MKLRALLKDIAQIEIKGSKDIEITGVTSHSKQVFPGNLFIAKRGQKQDGSNFVPEAIAAGAKAVLTDLYDPLLKGVTQIICANVAKVEGLILAQFYQQPDQALFMVGVTGTKGKTTTTYLIRHLLNTLEGDNSCGLIGTIEYLVGKNRYEASHTTPDISYNYRLFREMVRFNAKSCVMEVSSHALDQGRVQGIDYDCAIFTNLTHEHLDYHKTMQIYAESKAKLFAQMKETQKKAFEKTVIINVDNPWSPMMLQASEGLRIITTSSTAKADIYAENIHLYNDHSECTVAIFGEKYSVQIPLIGKFNIHNALSALAVAYIRGHESHKIIEAFTKFQGVRGRLEPIIHPYTKKMGISIFVDYAHAPDPLEQVLKAVKECTKSRLILVFGCGGNRDREKRPLMAQAAEKFADYTIVTSDNPRNEDPHVITEDIVQGFTDKKKFFIQLDRKVAIQQAINEAKIGDIVLIAGKGHETRQQFAFYAIDFDDRFVAEEILNKKLQQNASI